MKVSICIATYNGEKYIKEQLESILSQISLRDEVIISDDGSTDSTLEIIKNFKDPRITILQNTGKKGYTPNFQNALKHSSGDYIFLSDQDDVWLPNKYSTVLQNLKNNDLVVTNSKVTDENLSITNSSFFTIYNSGPGIFKNILLCTYYGSCMAFNKKVLSSSMPFPKNTEVAIDLWLGLVGEVVGKVKFIEEPLLLYRRSSNTVTQLGSLSTRSSRPLHLKIFKRFILFWSIFKFYLSYQLGFRK